MATQVESPVKSITTSDGFTCVVRTVRRLCVCLVVAGLVVFG